ncbi:MAG: alpha/beta hydrolase [Elusimicrobiota bacterium]
MPHKNVNGIEIYYEVHGKGEPLVLIMGLRRNIESWYRQISELSKHFQVIAFDNRGAGRTDKPAMDYSIRLFADDTAGLMDALNIKDAYIFGISMGGYIAQELAINHPQKVRKLILGCTSAGGRRAVLMRLERIKKFMANEGLSPEEILRKDMDIYFSDNFIADNKESIDEFVARSLRNYQPADAFIRQFEACRKQDTLDRIGAVSVPVLILTGDDDPLVPPGNSDILKELLPHAEFHSFPGGRHMFFIEEAEQVNRMARDFFLS